MKNHHILFLAVALLMGACGQKTEQRQKAPTRVKTEIISAASTGSDRSYVGIVEENEATAVSFTGMGTVRRVLVSEGQIVSRGQFIAELDDTQARNVLDGARASMAQAEDALARYSLLHEKGSMTDAQWVEVQSKVAQAKSQLAVAEKNLSDCKLLAPVSGIIGRKSISAGETAMPSQAVVTILDISTVKVRFSVPESEMSAITAQTPTRITVEAIDRVVSGGRIEKGVQADAMTHTYDVRVRVANQSRSLLPGMVAKVELDGTASSASSASEDNEPGRTAVAVPVTSVQRRSDGSLFVWTIADDNTAHRTPVQIGSAMGNRIEVLSGLTAGKRIVTEGYQKLSEGTKVVF
ncbi:MAG: efflux RND transporter periplasmic adaptor subunit [Bacteroidaceae bacterium]|nr:efflux RND transporter periplasmic adaptor subunit [Bacteroidaceae bacterium]